MAENTTDRTMQLVDAFLDKYEQGEMNALQTVCSADYISDYLSQKDEVPLSGTDKEVKSRMETLLDAFLEFILLIARFLVIFPRNADKTFGYCGGMASQAFIYVSFTHSSLSSLSDRILIAIFIQ